MTFQNVCGIYTQISGRKASNTTRFAFDTDQQTLEFCERLVDLRVEHYWDASEPRVVQTDGNKIPTLF